MGVPSWHWQPSIPFLCLSVAALIVGFASRQESSELATDARAVAARNVLYFGVTVL